LVAQLATIVFQNGFDHWIDAPGRKDFTSCLRAAADSLRDGKNRMS
jgi:hypothetical protein